ncbi:MAG: MotA/TolQ/ExbB proton channel family protein [Deltaproteobacteria bacterium]|nr:MotA/TolQ/ExbB proton channel family protein [Deltaproteobacteria bacterium]
MSASELLHLLQLGWYVTYPLGILSVIVFSISFERLWKFRGMEQATRDVTRKVVDHLLKRDLPAARALCEASTTPMSTVFAEGLRWGNFAVEDIQTVLATARQEFLTDLKRGIWFVGTIGSLAPYIGLLGTVIGIIGAFGAIAESGDAGFAVVSEGISEALIATAVGLLIAIIALLLYNYLNTRIAAITGTSARATERFVQALLTLEAGEAPHGGSASGR